MQLHIYFSLTDSEVTALRSRGGSSKKILDAKIQSESSSEGCQLVVAGEIARSGEPRKLFGFDVMNHCSEFALALCLGVAIGLSLLAGFVSGILYVTKPLNFSSSRLSYAEEIGQMPTKAYDSRMPSLKDEM